MELYENMNEEMDENVKENPKKRVRLATVLVRAAILLVLICLLFPFGMNLIREINIKKDMKSVYTDAKFVDVQCERKAVNKDELEKEYVWFGEELPQEDLYAFRIEDSEEVTARGYATVDGKVVIDTYGNIYYTDEMMEYFEETVNFEHEFPGVGIYILPKPLGWGSRYVRTDDCTTFEGYRKAGTVGNHFWTYLTSGGYPNFLVGIEDTREETITAIKQILAEAEFDIYINFSSMDSQYSDVNCLAHGEDCGKYYPFDASYGEAVLGDTTWEHLDDFIAK